MAAPLQCPQCRSESVLRTPCFSLVERLASLLFISPLRCQGCSLRFLTFRLGRRYSTDRVDRREHKRIPVRLFLSFSGGRVRGDGTVLDISMGGCVIKSKTLVKPGDIFYLQIVLDERQPGPLPPQSPKLRGWLLLLALGILLLPLRLTEFIAVDLLPAFSKDVWSLLTTPGTEAYHPLNAPILLFELVGNLVLLIGSIVLTVLFFHILRLVCFLSISFFVFYFLF